jgi:hypothetical protein
METTVGGGNWAKAENQRELARRIRELPTGSQEAPDVFFIITTAVCTRVGD